MIDYKYKYLKYKKKYLKYKKGGSNANARVIKTIYFKPNTPHKLNDIKKNIYMPGYELNEIDRTGLDYQNDKILNYKIHLFEYLRPKMLLMATDKYNISTTPRYNIDKDIEIVQFRGDITHHFDELISTVNCIQKFTLFELLLYIGESSVYVNLFKPLNNINDNIMIICSDIFNKMKLGEFKSDEILSSCIDCLNNFRSKLTTLYGIPIHNFGDNYISCNNIIYRIDKLKFEYNEINKDYYNNSFRELIKNKTIFNNNIKDYCLSKFNKLLFTIDILVEIYNRQTKEKLNLITILNKLIETNKTNIIKYNNLKSYHTNLFKNKFYESIIPYMYILFNLEKSKKVNGITILQPNYDFLTYTNSIITCDFDTIIKNNKFENNFNLILNKKYIKSFLDLNNFYDGQSIVKDFNKISIFDIKKDIHIIENNNKYQANILEDINNKIKETSEFTTVGKILLYIGIYLEYITLLKKKDNKGNLSDLIDIKMIISVFKNFFTTYKNKQYFYTRFYKILSYLNKLLLDIDQKNIIFNQNKISSFNELLNHNNSKNIEPKEYCLLMLNECKKLITSIITKMEKNIKTSQVNNNCYYTICFSIRDNILYDQKKLMNHFLGFILKPHEEPSSNSNDMIKWCYNNDWFDGKKYYICNSNNIIEYEFCYYFTYFSENFIKIGYNVQDLIMYIGDHLKYIDLFNNISKEHIYIEIIKSYFQFPINKNKIFINFVVMLNILLYNINLINNNNIYITKKLDNNIDKIYCNQKLLDLKILLNKYTNLSNYKLFSNDTIQLINDKTKKLINFFTNDKTKIYDDIEAQNKILDSLTRRYNYKLEDRSPYFATIIKTQKVISEKNKIVNLLSQLVISDTTTPNIQYVTDIDDIYNDGCIKDIKEYIKKESNISK